MARNIVVRGERTTVRAAGLATTWNVVALRPGGRTTLPHPCHCGGWGNCCGSEGLPVVECVDCPHCEGNGYALDNEGFRRPCAACGETGIAAYCRNCGDQIDDVDAPRCDVCERSVNEAVPAAEIAGCTVVHT